LPGSINDGRAVDGPAISGFLRVMPSAASASVQDELRRRFVELGFDVVRFAATGAAAASDARHPRSLAAWLEAGMHADMHWMERTVDKRLDPERVLPGVRSIVVLGVSYWHPRLAAPATPRPRWARYAVYEDYHDTIKAGLVAAGRQLEELCGADPTDYRYYVDTGPVIDRGWAARAGVGFIGKNAMTISRDFGNWLFLAALLTRTEFEPDPPIRPNLSETQAIPPAGLLCGKCTRCLDACPTDAFAGPGTVDARRCISYHTIENKGVIPREFRPGIGDRIYGCDICLEVCPWNRFAAAGRQLLLSARHDVAELPLAEILALTPERFAVIFRRTPIKRLKLVGLLRNACIVAGNSGDATLRPALVDLAIRHPHALVRAHAVWAVFRLGGGELLSEARGAETDPLVLVEYAAETPAQTP
jgi:epoxyqueuosine reductase